MTDNPTTEAPATARANLRAFVAFWLDSAARGKPLPPTVVARLDRLLDEHAADARSDLTPIPLHWDRLVMPPTGEDDQTIVCCMADDGRPAALFLDPEQRARLGQELVAPDGDAEVGAPTPCSEPDPCEGSVLCDRHEEEQAHADGDHECCGVTCEVSMPSELMRNFILAKGYPGTEGALNELLRRAAEGRSIPTDVCQFHAPAGDPCDCGHPAGADCHPNPRSTR